MKKEMLLAIVSFFLITLTAITGVYAHEINTKWVIITKAESDITGDGIAERIFLMGAPYQEEDSFLKDIMIRVEASNGKTFSIPLESGAKASLQLIDLNHDGSKDLFTTIQTDDEGEDVTNYLYSLKNFTLSNLSVPEPLEMEAAFLNNYKAELKVKQTGKTYMFNLKKREKYYQKLGIFYKGKLNEPTELSVNVFSNLSPIKVGHNLVGLKGRQKVTGVANADTIAVVETVWNYDQGKWRLIQTNVSQDKSK